MKVTNPFFNILMFLFIFIPFLMLQAQQDTLHYQKEKIELTDGSVIVGKITNETPDSLSVKTAIGIELTIAKVKIKSRGKIEPEEKPETVEDKMLDRLFISPTGRGIKEGVYYLAAHELFFISGGFGIHKNFSFTSTISLIPGADNQLLFLNPKFTPFQYDYFNASIGLIFLTPVPSFSIGTFGYISATFGSPDFAGTLGFGTPVIDNSIFGLIVTTLGLEYRVSKHFKLITDNIFIFFPEDFNGLYSLGFRFISGNYSGEFGMYTNSQLSSGDGFPFIPWVSLTYIF